MKGNKSKQENGTESINLAANFLTLRRWLKLTQSEFIETYLTNEDGSALISTATLSGLENKAGQRASSLIALISDKLGVDAGTFELMPDYFAKNIELFFGALQPRENVAQAARPSGTVEALVQQLSDYIMDAMISDRLKPGDKLHRPKQHGAFAGTPRNH